MHQEMHMLANKNKKQVHDRSVLLLPKVLYLVKGNLQITGIDVKKHLGED